MAFHEKSAWWMLIALSVLSVLYANALFGLSGDGQIPPPNVPVLIRYTVALVIVAVIGHIIIAATAPSDANAEPDERERKIFDRAGRISGFVFGFGVVSAMLFYLFQSNGDALFYGVFACLVASQLVEYLVKIYLYRTALD
ncbi:hypothetical protein [Bowmanella sp. JS7-9]|uniref:Transmembrane protein n=1 Tax=Pseudobowmanella zhangzhouensis TaxID=1537679 RepID=A0ABW1XIQ1_9ALTE|nr:hypothetical protein [Bowmanella sp. JS7-9]